MSVMSFVNSLMLDFRCWIIPHFVYAVREDNAIKDPEIPSRIDGLTREMFA